MSLKVPSFYGKRRFIIIFITALYFTLLEPVCDLIYHTSTAVRSKERFLVTNTAVSLKINVKQSHYRPGVAQRVPGS